jgi:hypothetical protein
MENFISLVRDLMTIGKDLTVSARIRSSGIIVHAEIEDAKARMRHVRSAAASTND